MATASSTTSQRQWQEPLVQRLIKAHRGKNPEQIIESYADSLRHEAGQTRLPIRPHVIASLKGIRRSAGSYDFAGRIYAEANGQLVMDINTNDTPQRQHFTEAHELIHTAFPGFRQQQRYRADESSMERHHPNDEEEYLCDYGAAALLMPADLLEGAYSVAEGLHDVERLASSADVSLEAAGNRLVALADEPAVLLCLAPGHKPADRARLRRGEKVPKRLRVRYAFSRHVDVYVPRFKGADEPSPFARAAASNRISSGTGALPGAEAAGSFRIEAKRYGHGDLERVLAIARPTA